MDKDGIAALDASIRNRTLFYKAVFDELRAELGQAGCRRLTSTRHA